METIDEEFLNARANELKKLLADAGFTEQMGSPYLVGEYVVVQILADVDMATFSERVIKLPDSVRVWKQTAMSVADRTDGSMAIAIEYHKQPSFGLKL